MKQDNQSKSDEFKIVSGAVSPADVLVYEYGARVDKDTAEFANAQIAKSRRLYNELVAIMQAAVTELQAFVIVHADAGAVAAQKRIGELNTQFAAAKAEDDEASMKHIAQERRTQWYVLSGYLREARKTHRTEIQERFLSRIGNKSTCATYQARSRAVNDGLGWGTANAVLEAALTAFKKSFALGRAPRFAAGNEIDQDCLTLQFTLTGGLPAQALLTGKQADFKLLPTNGCGPRKYGEFSFRLGPANAAKYANGTFQYHRPIPEGASIGRARLIRRRVGQKNRWAIQLMVKLKEPVRVATAERQPLAAIHFGWAGDVNGRRVAAITDAADPGCSKLIVLPAEIETALERAAEIQSLRDANRDEIAVQVRQIPVPETASDPLKEIMERIKRTRPQDVSANRLHYLCRLLAAEDRMPEWLDAWRSKDKLRWQDQVHIAKRARNRRKTFYRQIAIDIARSYETIAIEPLDLAGAAVKVDEQTGVKTEFAKKARAGRVVAALYELESAIRWAVSKTGAALLEITGPTASACAICGGTVAADSEQHQILHCGNCGATVDRKLNGAAVAWQEVNKQREDAVKTFWLEFYADRDAKGKKKRETLEKRAQGRRDAKRIRREEFEGARTPSDA